MPPNWEEINRCPIWKVLGVTECDNCDTEVKCWGEEVVLPESNKSMKVLVCGDRNWTSRLIIKEWLKYLKPDLVIEGECRGADLIGKSVAKELGIPVDPHPANWEQYHKAAGNIRNREMLDLEPDLVLAFHFYIEESKGTADCLTEAERRGIPYAVIGLGGE